MSDFDDEYPEPTPEELEAWARAEREHAERFWGEVDARAPAGEGPPFLGWLRELLERCWREGPPPWLEDKYWPNSFHQSSPEARWLAPLEAREVSALEEQAGFVFPQCYRDFLSTLHAATGLHGGHGFSVDFRSTPWIDPRSGYDRAFTWSFFVNRDWMPQWGELPSTLEGCLARAKELLASAGRIVRVHRAMVVEPGPWGHPVLSIYDMDTILYGSDLRDYLLNELLMPGGVPLRAQHDPALLELPFWGAVLDYNGFGGVDHYREKSAERLEGADARVAEYRRWLDARSPSAP